MSIPALEDSKDIEDSSLQDAGDEDVIWTPEACVFPELQYDPVHYAPAFLDYYMEADDSIAHILMERAAEGGGQCWYLPERLENYLLGWLKIRIWRNFRALGL